MEVTTYLIIVGYAAIIAFITSLIISYYVYKKEYKKVKREADKATQKVIKEIGNKSKIWLVR